jgi:hypothetical protein
VSDFKLLQLQTYAELHIATHRLSKEVTNLTFARPGLVGPARFASEREIPIRDMAPSLVRFGQTIGAVPTLRSSWAYANSFCVARGNGIADALPALAMEGFNPLTVPAAPISLPGADAVGATLPRADSAEAAGAAQLSRS